MLTKWIKYLTLSAVAMGFSAISFGQNTTENLNIVTTSVPFLRISPDARSGAMGDASIAVSADANATFTNASKIPFASSKAQVGVTFTPWLKDIASDVYLATLGAYYQIDETQAIHGGLRYFNLGQMQFVDEQGTLLQTKTPREFSFEAGYSRKLSENFGIGATFRYISSNLGSGTFNGNTYQPGNAIAGDISATYDARDEYGEGFSAGLAFSNLGSKISYSDDPNSANFLPANLGLGGAYTTNIDDDNQLTFAADLNHLLVPPYPENIGTGNVNETELAEYYNTGVIEGIGKSFSNGAYAFSVGAEYSYIKQFFVRAGYFGETKEAGGRNYFSAGVGVKYNVFGLNFSYLAPQGNSLNRNPLSNTLRFSLLFDVAGIEN